MDDAEFKARFIAAFKSQAKDVFTDWSEAETLEIAEQYMRDVPRHEFTKQWIDDPEGVSTEAIDECKATFDWDGDGADDYDPFDDPHAFEGYPEK